MSHYTLMGVGFDTQEEFEEMMDCYREGRKVAPYISLKKNEIMSDEFMKKNMTLYNQSKGDPEKFYELYTKGELVDREGNVLSTYNPDSCWDYYSIEEETTVGDILNNKPSVNEDLCRAKYKALADGDAADYERITGVPAVAGLWGYPTGEEFKKLYGTEEEYLSYCKANTFSTYCVLTPCGWEQAGKVGWFGISSASFEDEKNWEESFSDKFLKPYAPDETVYILDCHI